MKKEAAGHHDDAPTAPCIADDRTKILIFMETAKTIIGIDPDVNESGVAVLTPQGELSICKMTFPELVDYLHGCAASPSSFVVVVEKGWFTQTNFHLRGKGQRYAARQGVDVGRNHETGRKIVEMAEHFGLKVETVTPLPKVWRGSGGKITTEELERYTGAKLGRCNQDQRDAALLAYSYHQDTRKRLATGK